jgi:hypothetical protein
MVDGLMRTTWVARKRRDREGFQLEEVAYL